ncbi:unnamed protein product, partial [Prorocentrum cordatum]
APRPVPRPARAPRRPGTHRSAAPPPPGPGPRGRPPRPPRHRPPRALRRRRPPSRGRPPRGRQCRRPSWDRPRTGQRRRRRRRASAPGLSRPPRRGQAPPRRRRRRRRRRRPRTGPPGRRSRTPRRSPGAKAPVGLRGARGRQPRGRSTASATCGSCCEGVARAWLGGRCFFGRAARSACGGALPSVGCQLLALYSRLHLITSSLCLMFVGVDTCPAALQIWERSQPQHPAASL